MNWAIRQLLTPFRYLLIQQGDTIFKSKKVYDWMLPVILAAISTLLLLAFPGEHGMFSERGIIGGFRKLLEVMIPFYIVALAAVATFERKGLDDEMKGHPAVLKMRRATGIYSEHILTRRQFICYLFGYLSSSSLCVFVALLTAGTFDKDIASIFYECLGSMTIYLKALVSFIVMIPVWQIVITTLLGVYFMSERLQVMADIER
jgi:hypothetical protein